MNRKKGLLIAAYFTFVLGFCFVKYLDYRSSFEYIQPYEHTSALPTTEPTEVIPETTQPIELPETKTSVTLPSNDSVSASVTEVTQPVEVVVFPLDLNTASVEELVAIPGIGEITATAIVSYRTAHGGFLNLAQLLEVNGIGDARYQTLLEYVYLEQEFPIEESVPEPETDPPVIPVINLNTATKEQLLLLPDCTEELADNILYLRDELIHIIHNPLEITMAEGVTDALYLSWEPYLAVDDEGGTQIPIHDWLETAE
ncbi:MAG: helix-hairpin-helix domain-containing protein [Oscillospiraceae bacterium]|nr:helix-hairpin-helix domain-containing protein [Oscillospiraceae bacterium]